MSDFLNTLRDLWPVLAAITSTALTAYFNIRNNAQKIALLKEQFEAQRKQDKESFQELKEVLISDARSREEIHIMRLDHAKSLHEEALSQTENMLNVKVKTLKEGMQALEKALSEIHLENKENAQKVSQMQVKMETILSYAEKHTGN